MRREGHWVIVLVLLILSVAPVWSCDAPATNENPGGPTALPGVHVGIPQVTGQITFAGGGGMSSLQFSSGGQAQNAGLSGDSTTTMPDLTVSGSNVLFQNGAGDTTGTVTQTANGQFEVTPDPGATTTFSYGTFIPDQNGQPGTDGRFVTTSQGSAPGDVKLTAGKIVLSQDPKVPLGVPGTKVSLRGNGSIQSGIGVIQGGRPVSAFPSPPGVFNPGQPLPDANVRYADP